MKTAGKLYHSGNVCLCKSYDNRNMDMDQVWCFYIGSKWNEILSIEGKTKKER
jgi:hypothetical protein